jgi:ubiquinone/menaquinone biosynthesis C-methylase UbiE
VKVPRELSLVVQYILDQWVPPRIRDSKWFMYLLMRLVLKDATRDFMTFKDSVFESSDEEFRLLYRRTGHVQELQGETDLNRRCASALREMIAGRNVLEVGCGRGYLAGLLSADNQVTACDIVVSAKARVNHPRVKFVQGSIEKLPFGDRTFDVVVSTHTLEHVRNLGQAVAELRRVARDEVIVVVPRQRPYKYTFSLHTQFFPYEWSLHAALGHRQGATITRLGDWLYREPIAGQPRGSRGDGFRHRMK